jgi:ABC-type sugar transport system ATPase subunit
MRSNEHMSRPGSGSGGYDETPALLRVVDLRKSFPGVQAIDRAAFDLSPGEIHALVGENGAGKSTMIKVLTGVHQPDSGRFYLNDQECRFASPIASQQLGIVAIHQEFTLIPALSVTDNLFLGRELSRGGLINSRHEHEKAREVLARLGTDLDPTGPVSALSVSEQQLVEIARALVADARLLIMDEPTAALTPREVDRLFEILRDLAEQGIGVIFVSHRLNEVFDISDRITVMRDGVTVATRRTAELSRRELIELMVGRPLEDEFPKRHSEPGSVRLTVDELSGGVVSRVSFRVRAGEILGFVGLMGAGRTDMARLIFGADRRKSGEVVLDGRKLDITTPREAIAAGICLLNEDRKSQGLVLCASALENFALPNLGHWSKFGLLNLRREANAFDDQVRSLAIKITGPRQRTGNLSGGNQQKLLVARWLETDSQVVMFDEPTRGIDVGAKYEMYVIIRRLAAEGKAIILISSELPEILGLCDRVLVMKSGRIAGEVTDIPGTTQEEIMAMAV